MVFLKSIISSLLLLILASLKLSSSTDNTTIFCPEIEKQSLLIFKASLQDPEKLLSSWDDDGGGGAGVNCCNWKGVICSNSSGHVLELRLQGSSNPFQSPLQSLSGELNPSLLNLKHLMHLDLSRNTFAGTIPSFIGALPELQFLAMSGSGFRGEVSTLFCNATNLRFLDLSGNHLNSTIPNCLYLCKSLEFLSLSGNEFSGHLTTQFGEFKNLEYVDLSDNSFSGEIPTNIHYNKN